MTTYRVTPSRLDGLDDNGYNSGTFHYNGKSPSFFTPLFYHTREEADWDAERIRHKDKPGIWEAYIDEIDDSVAE